MYTDTEVIRKHLMAITKFKWGFKLIAVTEEDSKESWRKRPQAVGVFVPTPMRDIAIVAIGNTFEPEVVEDLNLYFLLL